MSLQPERPRTVNQIFHEPLVPSLLTGSVTAFLQELVLQDLYEYAIRLLVTSKCVVAVTDRVVLQGLSAFSLVEPSAFFKATRPFFSLRLLERNASVSVSPFGVSSDALWDPNLQTLILHLDVREALIKASLEDEPSPRQKLKYSTAAGFCTGAFNGSLRGRANVIPAMIMMTGFGFFGQAAVNYIRQKRAIARDVPKKPFLQRVMESKWMPMKPIPDAEYVAMLEERALRLDAEIAILDEKIEDLRSHV
ncbi:MAG: hypothetical protein Q9227_004448 [Pyrenula ochraceoflavens]